MAALTGVNLVEFLKESRLSSESQRVQPHVLQEQRTSDVSPQGRPLEPKPAQPAPGPSLMEANAIPFAGAGDSGAPQNATLARQTWKNPPINRWRVVAACFVYLGNGMNDAAPGALLPYMEDYYHINYAIVATIFIANAVGFILAAGFVGMMDRKLGRSKTLMLNEAFVVAAYVVMAVAPPFPVFVIAYLVVGFGIATGLALNNVFTANLANPTVVLSCSNGSYGLGGLISPVIATAMVTVGVKFSYFYFIPMALRVMNLAFSGYTFRHFERDNALFGNASSDDGIELVNAAQTQSQPQKDKSQKSFWQALGNKYTLLAALFIFAYQGAEVSISGWVISFLITTRHADPRDVGYVTSGFWGGITVGRFALNNISSRVGEKPFVYALVAGTVAFQFVVWFAPNVVADSVATAIIGVLLGPVYPSSLVVFARILPTALQPTALAFISSAGSSGGAVAPFLTGLLAQARGTFVLHPICIALFVVMIGCWWAITRSYEKKKE